MRNQAETNQTQPETNEKPTRNQPGTNQKPTRKQPEPTRNQVETNQKSQTNQNKQISTADFGFDARATIYRHFMDSLSWIFIRFLIVLRNSLEFQRNPQIFSGSLRIAKRIAEECITQFCDVSIWSDSGVNSVVHRRTQEHTHNT